MFSKFGNSEVDGVPNKDEESNVTSPLFGVIAKLVMLLWFK